MPVALIKMWLGLNTRLINTYGTTEATVYQFAHEIRPEAALLPDNEIAAHARHLGTPFAGITYSVDDGICDASVADDGVAVVGETMPTSDCGELVLYGGQIGTDRNRWASKHSRDGIDGFYTGDIVRVSPRTVGNSSVTTTAATVPGAPSPNSSAGAPIATSCSSAEHRTANDTRGRLTFVGRSDKQVKLNGRRIELGPIETAISQTMSPMVERAAVVLSHRKLVAFCQLAHHHQLQPNPVVCTLFASAVRMLCRQTLATYLVPSSVMIVGTMPRTPTGKTDRRALASMCSLSNPATTIAAAAAAAAAAITAVRAAWMPTGWLAVVAAVWSTELGIAVQDFHTLSGDSLVALRICSSLWRLQSTSKSGTGGAFGESMGMFTPANLLTTSHLSAFADMLRPTSNAQHCQGGQTNRPRQHQHQHPRIPEGPVATATTLPPTTPPEPVVVVALLPLSETDKLAEEAVRLNEADLLQLLIVQSVPTPATLNRLLASAVRSNHGDCTGHLLRSGADANCAVDWEPGGATVLHKAAQHKDGAIVSSLLLASADVRALDHNSQTAMHHAARTGAEEACFGLLLKNWEETQESESIAAEHAAEMLLRGAGRRDEGGCGAAAENAAAAAALQHAQLHFSSNLYAYDALDKWGRTPLHWAVNNGHRSAIVALCEAGSDVGLRDCQDDSPLDLAERRAACREWLGGQDGGQCDQLTLNLLKLML